MNILKSATVSATVLLTSTAALASQDVWTSVDVEADLSAFEQSNALDYWPTLERDLSAAIAERVDIRAGEDAPALRVEINKVAIDGNVVLPATGEFNEIVGTIAVIDDGVPTSSNNEVASQNIPEQSFALRVYAQLEEGQTPPEGYILVAPSKDDFYTALVDAYAKEVVEYVEQ